MILHPPASHVIRAVGRRPPRTWRTPSRPPELAAAAEWRGASQSLRVLVDSLLRLMQRRPGDVHFSQDHGYLPVL